MEPKFSTITDLYSVSQLQRALVEAAEIATELRAQVTYCHFDIGDELAETLQRLVDAAQAAKKASNG